MSHSSGGLIRLGWHLRAGNILLAVVLVLGSLAAWPQPVSAWKPVTHNYLSELVRLDAIADGAWRSILLITFQGRSAPN